MLKKIRVLFLGLMVLAGSACVTPTHASSADSVVISYIQAAGPSGAREELLVIYNNANIDVDITNWCIGNKAAVKFACFTPPSDENSQKVRFILPAFGYATAASQEYGAARSLNFDVFSVMYVVTHQTSGSIVTNADSISLIDSNGEVRDSYVWSNAPPTGKAFSRLLLLTLPDVYASIGTLADWSSIAWKTYPASDVRFEFIEEDPGGPVEEEVDPEVPSPNDESSYVAITEIFANAAGTDAGKEFIELYNTHPTQAMSLDGMRLRIGRDTAKWYSLPTAMSIPPLGYVVFFDGDLGFSLVNTSGGVQLYRGDVPLGARIEYESPKDNMSWTLVGGLWQYSSRPTPGTDNLLTIQEGELDKVENEKTPNPCATNQFRNPETGRCKLLSSTTSTATPCKAGQERNTETNRCRNIVTATAPTPCKEGQERNPDTNRCRNITKMSEAAHGIKGIQNKSDAQPSWYYWAGIIGVIVLVLGYGVWEWRDELRTVWRRLKLSFTRK